MKPNELQIKIAMGPNTIIEYFTPQQMADALESAIESAETSDIRTFEWRDKISELRGK